MKEKSRFFVSCFIISVLIMLVQLLFSIYEGAEKSALSYVKNSRADIWLCPKNESNLLRSSSVFDDSIENTVRRIPGVDTLSKIIKLISSMKIKGKTESLIIYGIDTSSTLAVPTIIKEGSSSITSGEIILDKVIAEKHSLRIGDSIDLSDRQFRLAGISDFTNAVTIQFGYITIGDAAKLLGISGKVSFYALKKKRDADEKALIKLLKHNDSNVEAFAKDLFVENNLSEVGKGILPVLWTIAITGSIAGIIIIALMLQNSITEKREEYAVMRALGASKAFLIILVMRISVLITFLGYLLGTGLNLGLSFVLPKIVPELVAYTSFYILGTTMIISLLISLIGSWIPISKLFSIQPAEVFKP